MYLSHFRRTQNSEDFILSKLKANFRIFKAGYLLTDTKRFRHIAKYRPNYGNYLPVLVELLSQDSTDKVSSRAFLLSQSHLHNVGFFSRSSTEV